MARTRRLLLMSLVLLSGCRGGPVQQETDRILFELASRPFDAAPPLPKAKSEEKEKEAKETSLPTPHSAPAGEPQTDIRTAGLLRAESAQDKQGGKLPEYELKVPAGLPGAEAPILPDFKKLSPEQVQQTIQRLYPELPSLPEEPVPQPGPNGRPYDLADFQKLAVENSPTLRQAVSDVKSAEGALAQAKMYPNPTVAYQASPTNNNSNAGAQGGYIEQPIRTFGKMKLGIAAAKKDLDNAQLALRRARYDLSTNVRNAYYALIVAKETMRVNRALAAFTDEIYRLYVKYSAGGLTAPYEPAPLRASAYTNRLAYLQSIRTYVFSWQQLVATLGLSHLPLTEVQGRIDRLIPYYDYDKVLAHVLANHTDVLTARNGVEKAKYNLQLAQVTPLPDVDVLGAVWKESTIAPYVIFYQAQIVVPIPIWDRNKGNIISAQAAMIRALEEPHRVENALTSTLAANYANYQNNLSALEYYRRWILPDQVRYYRGIFERRQAEIGGMAPGSLPPPPADLVTAQAGLAAAVQSYLGILGALWTSVVSVADLIQTPDLFQQDLASQRELPELPRLDQMPAWLCPHQRMGGPTAACSPGLAVKPVPVPPVNDPVLPAPRQLPEPPPEMPKRSKDDG